MISLSCESPEVLPQVIGYTTSEEGKTDVVAGPSDITGVWETTSAVLNGTNILDGLDLIYIWDDGIDSNLLKNVVIVSNFDVVEQTITPYFSGFSRRKFYNCIFSIKTRQCY